jgi:arylsulfatase A-like enzyme
MNRRCLAALLFVASQVPGVAATAPRPNILLILSDDQGYGDVGVHGLKEFATPHLDSIARNGVLCTDAYVSAPQCAPARCGILTGRYQQRFGYEYNNDSPGIGLPLGERTIADRLKGNGYVTGLVGKWHLGKEDAFHPLERGFTEFYGFLGGGHTYLARPAGKAAPRSELMRNREPVPHTKYLTDQFGDEAVAFVERHAAAPWFLFLSFNAPHSPVQATPEYLARVPDIANPKRRTYAAMVTAMDDNIGRVLAKLRATRQEERTLVIFLSDNGGPLGSAWNGSSNLPFRGQKGDTFEGGIRVPFFAQWKGVLPAGQRFTPPVISLDLVPTILAAAGVVAAEDAPALDGVNLLPAWKGEAALAARALYWRFNFPPARETLYKSAMREGDWKLVKSWERTAGGEPQPSVLKLINLAEDPGETRDRMATDAERARSLQNKWDAWNAGLAEPFGGAPRDKDRPENKAKRPRRPPPPPQ